MSIRRTAGLVVVIAGFAAGTSLAQAKQQGKPAPAGKSMTLADSIVARERSLFDALAKNDFLAFNKGLGSDFVYVDGNGAVNWELAKSADMMKGCTMGKWSISDTKVTPVGKDLVVLTYTAKADQTCNGQKSPSPVNALSVWQRRGGGWGAVAHSETPTNPPPKK